MLFNLSLIGRQDAQQCKLVMTSPLIPPGSELEDKDWFVDDFWDQYCDSP